ncbi:MAG: phosphatidylinositol mannoside acyltransferase [Actinomycetota bacterium]
MSTLTERASLAGYRAGWSLTRRLPDRLAYRSFDLLADAVWRRGGKGVERMRSNYGIVRPELSPDELDALVRAGMRSYLRYWCDSFRLPDRSIDELIDGVRVVGDTPVRAKLKSGRSAIMFLGHMGNWDFGGAWSTTQLAPVTTVAERLKPEELFDEFLAFREQLGMRIIPLTGGGDVFRELTKACRSGALVALLADRDLTKGGIEVDFCGQRARMAVGPAALAVNTGAALHPCMVHYEPHPRGRGWRTVVTFHDAVPVPAEGTSRDKVRALTQACADVLSEAVREHTEDWHMMQRVFTKDLDDDRLAEHIGDRAPGETR